MDEKTQPQPVTENKTSITFSIITQDTAPLLAELRQTIDQTKPEKALPESQKFASHEGGKVAILAFEGFTPFGYVELKKDEELPDGAHADVDLTEYAHLARIGVVEDARGKGIGTQLMNQAEEWTTQQDGKKGLWLEYRNDNAPANALYEKSGYRKVGEFVDNKGNQRTIVVKEIQK